MQVENDVQGSSREISPTGAGSGGFPHGEGVMGQHPNVVEDGPTGGGPSQPTGWAGAGYFPDV